jgi:Vacuolar import and degradation protein
MNVCSACALHLVQDPTGQTLVCTGCGHREPASGATIERRSSTRDAIFEKDPIKKNIEVTERGRRLVTRPPLITKPPLKALQVDFPSTNIPQIPSTLYSPIEPKPSFLDPIPSLSANRVSSSAYDSLYPGALFEGIQMNKTKEHRVSVRIVDINLQQSSLSGFLTIHDLTDQHPEITTFFDGQIIRDTHGFVTNDWGASEEIDMLHW